MARQGKKAERDIETYAHAGKERVNNPPVGLVTPETDKDAGKKAYAHDPHLDPQLQWAGKTEYTSFEAPTVSLHVHERIDPRTIVEAVRKRNGAEPQMSLFAAPGENPPIRKAIEFYKHRHNWTNRLIAGDSLLVMNSLLEKEGLGGQVQMVYIDPPYGIRYKSNFQPFVNKRDVTDGRDEDLTQEPETLRAFRDTWELGIHSWLTYLRDRLLLARELLSESGSVFVQIGDENLDLTTSLVADVFGRENRVATISFVKTGGSSTGRLPEVADYLVWYARDIDKLKYRQLYEPLTRRGIGEFFSSYAMLELADGSSRSLTKEERDDPGKNLPDGARIYRRMPLVSPGTSTTGRSGPHVWNGVRYDCPTNKQWRVSVPEGMDRLAELGRLTSAGERSELSWKWYEDEVPGRRIHNVWPQQMSAPNPRYVVETYTKVIERCILMTTDPGDLALDITCGSGVTAYVAEQWGRRWITCDSSRVAVTLARQRLMAATFDYYELAHPDEGVGSGFEYRTVPKVSAGSLAYGRTEKAVLYDQPLRDKTKARVTGPFTMEAVPAPAVKSLDAIEDTASQADDASVARSGETLRQNDWRDELLKTGIRGKAGQRISFARLEPLPGTRWLHAEGETRPGDAGAERIAVSFGPDHAPLEQRQVALAIEEAQSLVPRPKIIVFAAFQFDPEASKDIDETHWPGVVLLKAQMNADLLTDDLKKKRASNESFWLIGQPDVVVVSEQWLVDSMREAVAPYAVIAKLSGVDSLEEIRSLGRDDLSLFVAIAERRDLWDAVATDAGGGVDTGQHRGGSSPSWQGRVSTLSGDSTRLPRRIGDAADFVQQLKALTRSERDRRIEALRRDRQITDRAREIATSLTGQLSTIHYSQATIQGFDYYNTRTGNVESGGADKIAMWMLDLDYDGRSLFPRQVFFPWQARRTAGPSSHATSRRRSTKT